MPRDVVTSGLLEDRPAAGNNGATFFVVGPPTARGHYIDDGVNWLPLEVNRTMQVKVIDDLTGLTTGDNKFVLIIDATLNLLDLVAANAYVSTPSNSGGVTVQLRRINRAPGDLLTTRVTIDQDELSSYDAAVPAVIDQSADTVRTGDLIAVDVDTAGVNAKGLGVVLSFA